MKKWADNKGFTIVELLIVVVVIAILAAIVIVAYNGITDRSRQSSAQQSLATVSKKIRTTVIEQGGAVPTSLASIGVTDTSAVTYQLMSNTEFTPNTYCLTVNSGKYSYHIGTGGQQTDGPCPGHTGQAPANLSCPAGFVTVPGNSMFGTKAFCAMKYEAKNSGGTAISVAAGTPWVTVNQSQAQAAATGACSGCSLMNIKQWLTIAHNAMMVPENWTGGAVGSGILVRGNSDGTPANTLAASSDSDGYSGTGNSTGVDPHQRRTITLSNGEVIWDFSGNAWEMLGDTNEAAVGSQPGLPTDTVNNFVYKQWTAPGITTGSYAYVFPGYGNAAAVNWNSAQGMGQLITSSAQPDSRTFIMGGAHTTGAQNTSLFTLRMNYLAEQASSSTGFRAVYAP